MTTNAQTTIKDALQNYAKFKRQAETLADEHKWVSFKYKDIHYYGDSLLFEGESELIIKYDGKNSSLFYNINSIEWFYLLDKDYYKKIEKPEGSLIKYENTIFDFDRYYDALGKYGFIPRFFIDIPYYIYPISFAESMNMTQIFNEIEEREIDGELYNVYKFDNNERRVRFYVNAATNIMDSAYTEIYQYSSKVYYTFYDFSFENRQSYIDSIFNFDNKEYEKYSKYDIVNSEPYYSFDTIVTDKLLDFPLVDLNNDTTTLREQEGWVLLNFCTITSDYSMRQLDRYAKEKDSLGYRILEKEGIKIMAIEHKSNNMEYIEKYAKRYHSEDITYSAKGIFNAIDVNWWECYYLISPDKKAVYRTEKLGDYSEIINKLKLEN
jgi:hypothetical protein